MLREGRGREGEGRSRGEIVHCPLYPPPFPPLSLVCRVSQSPVSCHLSPALQAPFCFPTALFSLTKPLREASSPAPCSHFPCLPPFVYLPANDAPKQHRAGPRPPGPHDRRAPNRRARAQPSDHERERLSSCHPRRLLLILPVKLPLLMSPPPPPPMLPFVTRPSTTPSSAPRISSREATSFRLPSSPCPLSPLGVSKGP